MAITPRSFALNPGLIGLGTAALLIAGIAILFGPHNQAFNGDDGRAECLPSSHAPDQWGEAQWWAHVQCLADSGDGHTAYRAADRAVSHYPSSEALLNLRGFVAGRNGDHAVAAYDFRRGQQLTGSPSGVFENNIAWSTLWLLDDLSPERAHRALLDARRLYEQSLNKQWSCERVHTGLFVEFALLGHQTNRAFALDRYNELYQQYEPCWDRVATGDELVVEEISSAAIMDEQLRTQIDPHHSARHRHHLRQALRRASDAGVSTGELCKSAIPVAPARVACLELIR